MKNGKNYEQNIQRGLIAKKSLKLPWPLFAVRNYDLLNNKDSARYYYKYYINKTTSNEIVFNYLINELEQNNFLEAEKQ
jgi:hypothetical protein